MRRLLVALALLLLPACGGEDGSTDEGAAPGGPVVEVTLKDFTIDPSAIDVEPGSYTFHVVNDGQTVHALEVEGPGGEMDTDELEPGASADLNVGLAEDGDYEMYCPVGDHHDRGMEGTITVGGGGAGTTTDETTTDDESGYGY